MLARRLILPATVLAGLMGFAGTPPAAAQAVVDDEAELRAAFTDPAETEITLAAEITLSCDGGGELSRTSAAALTVHGDGHSITQSCADARVMAVSGGALTVVDITIRGGEATPGGGGAIFSDGRVTVTESVLDDNSARGNGGAIRTTGDVQVAASRITGNTSEGVAGGGGVSAAGAVTVEDSVLAGNTAGAAGGNGGAIRAGGDVEVTGSSLTGNTSGSGGGAIRTDGTAAITVTDSTIAGNRALADVGYGGGLRSVNGLITVRNSTVTGNDSGNRAGGIGGGDVRLVHATVAGNSAPEMANLNATGLTSFGSVVALPGGGGSDCAAATTTSQGFNFSSDGSCGFTGTGDQQDGGDPQLGELADNGGPTQTRLPEEGARSSTPYPPRTAATTHRPTSVASTARSAAGAIPAPPRWRRCAPRRPSA